MKRFKRTEENKTNNSVSEMSENNKSTGRSPSGGGKNTQNISCLLYTSRYACHETKKPFVSFPTAPSVDGFVSGIAAMTIRGRKISYPSTPPVALFADADIYETAPPELTDSGIGDIVGKYVSLFDWKFASLITDETVEEEDV